MLTKDESPEQREQEYASRWQRGGAGFTGAYGDVLLDAEANGHAADYVRRKISEIVDDPDVAAALTPQGFPIGAKRLCVDTDYYATHNRPKVTLVDVRADPIHRVDGSGVLTSSGTHHDLDLLVCATGFDAMTGALLAMDIRGRDGSTLAETWTEGPRAYLRLPCTVSRTCSRSQGRGARRCSATSSRTSSSLWSTPQS